MAYMDEMALEREKSKQAMIAGKTPMFGADTTAAMHQLGISLGVIPPGTPPSQTTQVLEGLLKGGPGKVKVDEAHPLQVPTLTGRTTASLAPHGQADDGTGATLGAIFKGASDSALQQMLRNQQRQQGPTAPAGPAAPAAPATPPAPGANRARLSGNTPLARGNDLAGVDPKIAQSAKEWAQVYNSQNGPHSAQFTSGYRPGDPREHGRANAFDMQLVDKSTGKALENYRTNDPKTFAAYQDYANGYHQYLEANYPDLAAKHRWGGYFSGDTSKYGSLDQMHHDFAGDRIGMAGGSWKGGLTPQQAKLFPGLTANTGGLAGKPPMAAGKPTLTATPNQSNPAGAPAAGAAGAAGGPQAGGVPPELSNWVAKKENFTPKAFTDYGSNNIGYGTAANGRTSIDEPTARAEMNAELGKHLATIDALNPNTPPAIRNSLASLGFNTGGAALNNTGLAAAVKAGDWKQAKQIFMQYDKVTNSAGQKTPLHGLTVRRGQEAQAFDNPNFYKDPNSGTTAAQDWGGTQHPAAAAPTAAPQVSPQASAQPSPQLGPSGEEPLLPEPSAATPATPATPPAAPAPAPVAATPTAAPAAAAPVPPPVAAPPVAEAAKPAPPAPPKPAAPPVNPAHAILDTKVIDLVKRGGTPEQAAQVPGFIGNKTLREAMQIPMVGGQVANGVRPYLPKMGITPQQFDQAVKEGPPKAATLGKRSDLGTSDATDFSSRGRTPAPSAAPEAAPAQSSAPAPGEQVPLPQPGPRTENRNAAQTELNMTPEERALYDRHLGNLWGPGGVDNPPTAENPEPSRSTLYQANVEIDGKHYNIPTVYDGKKVPVDEAVARAKAEGIDKFPSYPTPDAAEARYEQMHQFMNKDTGQYYQQQQPQITPGIAKALEDAVKIEEQAPAAPPSAGAMPVLPGQPVAPTPGPGSGGLSLAPAGLSSIPTGALPTGAPGSQGGSIAMAGMLPPIQNSTYSTPLLDQTAATAGSGMGLSPIPLQTLGSWGWGGGNIGAGLDWGGGAPEVPMGAVGGFD